jgi:hypothetical protein
MLRPFVCAVLALGIAATASQAEPPRPRFMPFRPPVNFPRGGDANRAFPGGGVIGDAKKTADTAGKQFRGTIQGVDADANTITVSIGKGDEAKDVDFKIGDAKIISGKNAVKLANLKTGSTVTVITGGDGKTVKQVVVAGQDKKEGDRK